MQIEAIACKCLIYALLDNMQVNLVFSKSWALSKRVIEAEF